MCLLYVQIFILFQKASTASSETYEDFRRCVDVDTVWSPASKSFDEWLTSLTSVLLTSGGVCDPLLRLMAPVCRISSAFAQRVLPFVVHNILATASQQHKQLLSIKFNRFFSNFGGDVTNKTCSDDVTRRKCVRALLDVVQYLRLQPRPNTS